MQRTPRPSAFLPAAIALSVIGFGGFILLVNLGLPVIWPRWLFFFLILVAVTGVSLPLSAFLNFRFQSQPPAHSGVVVRQALLAGIYLTTIAWLFHGQVLTGNIALVFLAGLAAIEVMIRLWERSRWQPE